MTRRDLDIQRVMQRYTVVLQRLFPSAAPQTRDQEKHRVRLIGQGGTGVHHLHFASPTSGQNGWEHVSDSHTAPRLQCPSDNQSSKAYARHSNDR